MPVPQAAGSQRRPRPVIRTPDQRLRVFVSSIFRDLAEEREAARQAIAGLHLTPVLFELGARPHPPRNLYRAYLLQSHVFVGIYWQRYGWVAPGMEISGLEDEYRLARDMPRLIYLKRPAPDREPRLNELLNRIKQDAEVAYKYFSDADELGELVANDLAVLLTERFEQARLRPEAPATPPPTESRSPLPHLPTSFVGRRAETEAVRALLSQPDVRLVTLTGPGGVGKTRLGLEVAGDMAEAFEHGVHWVNLAPLRDPERVLPAIAQALDVRERGGDSLQESLSAYLRDKRLLLLLDNFEHLLPAASILSALLASAPRLRVLVTSRASLHLRGEHEYPVPPLPVPEEADFASPNRLGEVAAVRLFVERARSVRSDFALTPENTADVTDIVRRLDGLPLAIELSAARSKLLPPRLILDRLADRLALLTGGPRDLPPRQQTIRSVIDWSYGLLAPDEQRLFARLGVFVDGFTLAAAEEICDSGDGGDVLEGIAALLDHSLLRQEAAPYGQPRFGMLGTIRAYALERLGEADEQERLRRRHAAFYSDLAAEIQPRFYSDEGEVWLDRLETEHGNLSSAVEWSLSSPEDRERGWRILLDLTWMWYRRGYLTEARRWYEKAIEQTASLGDSLMRGLILNNAGMVAMWQSDLATAAHLMDEGVLLLRRLGDPPVLARALFGRGVLAVNQGDASEATSYLEEALALFEQAGQQWFRAIILLHLGNVALSEGDLDGARSYLSECHTLGRAVGDQWIVGSAVNNLGELARYQGEHERAAPFYRESREIFREIGSEADVARADHSLAWIALWRGEHARSASLFERALALHQRLGVKRGVVECLAGLGAVKGMLDEAASSVALLSFARAEMAAYGAGIWPADEADWERALSAMRDRMDERAFDVARQSGRAMTLERALAAARLAPEPLGASVEQAESDGR